LQAPWRRSVADRGSDANGGKSLTSVPSCGAALSAPSFSVAAVVPAASQPRSTRLPTRSCLLAASVGPPRNA